MQGDGASAVMLGLFGAYTAFMIASVVIIIASLWIVFSKAGWPGWAAVIPFYNTYVLVGIVGRPMLWFLLLFVPIVNIVISLIVTYDLARSFGFGLGMTVGLALLPMIFYPMLAFGPTRYLGPAAAPGAEETAQAT